MAGPTGSTGPVVQGTQSGTDFMYSQGYRITDSTG